MLRVSMLRVCMLRVCLLRVCMLCVCVVYVHQAIYATRRFRAQQDDVISNPIQFSRVLNNTDNVYAEICPKCNTSTIFYAGTNTQHNITLRKNASNRTNQCNVGSAAVFVCVRVCGVCVCTYIAYYSCWYYYYYYITRCCAHDYNVHYYCFAHYCCCYYR